MNIETQPWYQISQKSRGNFSPSSSRSRAIRRCWVPERDECFITLNGVKWCQKCPETRAEGSKSLWSTPWNRRSRQRWHRKTDAERTWTRSVNASARRHRGEFDLYFLFLFLSCEKRSVRSEWMSDINYIGNNIYGERAILSFHKIVREWYIYIYLKMLSREMERKNEACRANEWAT